MIRPTRRGLAVAGVALLAVVAAWAFGPRSLNAVAVPAVVALGVGLVGIAVADATVEWPVLPAGHRGTTVAATVALTGSEGTVVEAALEADGLAVDPDRIGGVLPVDGAVTLDREHRGTATLGPATIAVLDRLGLWRRQIAVTEEVTTTVFPRVVDLRPEGPLAPLIDPTSGTERQEFDRVRRYVPGDALNDIHWPSTAKRDDLFVIEFADRRPDEDVLVVASGPPAAADEIAEATASIVVAALSAGQAVGLVAGDRRVDPGRGRDHRFELLSVLAAYDGEPTPQAALESATVRVTHGPGGPAVGVEDATVPFDRLRADRSGEAPTPRREAPA